MLINKLRSPLGISAWSPSAGLHQQVYATRPRHTEQAEPKEPAQLPYSRIMLATAAADRCAYGQPNFIAGCRAINALQHQIEIEPEFQLADDDHWRRPILQRDEIAAADFTFHVKSQNLQEALHWEV